MNNLNGKSFHLNFPTFIFVNETAHCHVNGMSQTEWHIDTFNQINPHAYTHTYTRAHTRKNTMPYAHTYVNFNWKYTTLDKCHAIRNNQLEKQRSNIHSPPTRHQGEWKNNNEMKWKRFNIKLVFVCVLLLLSGFINDGNRHCQYFRFCFDCQTKMMNFTFPCRILFFTKFFFHAFRSLIRSVWKIEVLWIDIVYWFKIELVSFANIVFDSKIHCLSSFLWTLSCVGGLWSSRFEVMWCESKVEYFIFDVFIQVRGHFCRQQSLEWRGFPVSLIGNCVD